MSSQVISQFARPVTTSVRSRKRVAGTVMAGVLAAGALLLTAAAPALAHDELVGTELVAGPTDGTIDAVQLSFNNSIVEVGTEITVSGPNDESVADGDPLVSGPDVTQPLIAELPTGEYRGAWRVVSSDGHPIEGEFSFTLSGDETADTLPEIVEGTPSEAEHDHPEDGNSDEAHEHDDEVSDANIVSEETTPVWLIIVIVVGGVGVIASIITGITVGQRRRARGMNGNNNENNA